MSDASRAVDARGDPDGAAALVLAPGVSTEDARVCADRLAAADAALVVSLRRTPRNWQAARDGPLPPTGFVTTDSHPGSVRAVADPGDLTGIGIAVSEYLGDLPGDAEPAVCLDSLTTLLQFAEPERAYRFLQVLCGRVRAAGGTVHCHADPAAHDDAALERLAGLFDGVLSVET
ncbi:hypothetical protein [Halobacterium sp. R2-5]|uniref:DUF7504 family protein n=1 Tax=Halobacterium sp. R2-5 TaxID=2715751 RepID=UPI00142487D1|nr:hypothetical protein [Halobacterium sp. R2-5]NIB98146.1 hypothetical protein [Halobacterium sp. R2-5]